MSPCLTSFTNSGLRPDLHEGLERMSIACQKSSRYRSLPRPGTPPCKCVVCHQAPHCKPAEPPALAVPHGSDVVQVQAPRVAGGIKAAPQRIHQQLWMARTHEA